MALFSSACRSICATVLFLTVAACTAVDGDAMTADGIYDPYEAQNRHVHAFNRDMDKVFVRPISIVYTTVLPDEIEDSVNNFSRNLSSPSIVVNSILQGDLRGAGIGTVRFATNSTLGLLGLFDAASDFGVPEHDTDFGETLYVWGVGEGAYLELPLYGYSNQRDAVGVLVDFFTNPLSYVGLDSPEKYVSGGTRVARAFSERGRFADTVDSILYDSADSYAQTRLIGTQILRFELGDEGADTQNDPFSLDTEGF